MIGHYPVILSTFLPFAIIRGRNLYLFLSLCPGSAARSRSHPALLFRPPLRHDLALYLSLVPFRRHVQFTVTAAVFLDVRIAVHAGADDVGVLFLHAPGEAAGA